jgi:hypothetical protein
MFFGKPAGQWSLRESTARLVAQLLRSQGVGAAHLRTVAVRGVVRAKANRSSTKRFIRMIEWTIIEWHALTSRVRTRRPYLLPAMPRHHAAEPT